MTHVHSSIHPPHHITLPTLSLSSPLSSKHALHSLSSSQHQFQTLNTPLLIHLSLSLASAFIFNIHLTSPFLHHSFFQLLPFSLQTPTATPNLNIMWGFDLSESGREGRRWWDEMNGNGRRSKDDDAGHGEAYGGGRRWWEVTRVIQIDEIECMRIKSWKSSLFL